MAPPEDDLMPSRRSRETSKRPIFGAKVLPTRAITSSLYLEHIHSRGGRVPIDKISEKISKSVEHHQESVDKCLRI